MSIVDNYIAIKRNIPQDVKLVAVSKFHPVDAIQRIYDGGQRIFGESRMQELSQKHELLPSDIEWHFIGHLQTNKVKSILPYTHTIHSIDSIKLLKEIEKEAIIINKIVYCLLEIHIAQEDSKYGLSFDECRHFLENGEWKDLKYAKISGIMGMATNTDDANTVRNEFKVLKSFFDEIKRNHLADAEYFKDISMGMSHDYKIAIEEGSTMVRVGSSIFGEREY